MTSKLPWLAFALVLPGCLFNSVAKLEDQGKAVTVVPETEKPSECKFLGKLMGSSHSEDKNAAREGANNDFRNKAGALKANFAVVESEGGGRKGTSCQQEVVLNGKAYYCKTLDMQQAEEEQRQKAIDAKDQQAEKEQAEREAKEEEEKAKKEEKKGKKGKKASE
jgi:hypothetical protein